MKAKLVRCGEKIECAVWAGRVKLFNTTKARYFLGDCSNEKYYEKWENPNSEIIVEEYEGEVLSTVDDDYNITFYDQEFLKEIINIKYLSTTEYAKRVGKNQATIKKHCANGRIPNIKIGKYWYILENTPYPKDLRGGVKDKVVKENESERKWVNC